MIISLCVKIECRRGSSKFLFFFDGGGGDSGSRGSKGLKPIFGPSILR
jgi:hypothetical protein